MTTHVAMQKHEDDQYLDAMSPPSSANESETLQSISLSNNPTNFQSRFPPAMSDIDHDDDGSFMDDEDMGGDSHEERSGTVSSPDFHLCCFRFRPILWICSSFKNYCEFSLRSLGRMVPFFYFYTF